jgi:hypothetical protein
MKVVLSQNYFTFADNIYQPKKGIAMGSPISRITAEIFLRYYENMFLKHLFESQNITYDTRYVDDIFIIFDNTKIDPDRLTESKNSVHNDIICKPTHEINNQINFPDLLIIRKESRIEIDMYRKPTTTDTTINFLSNHPMEQKLAAYRYYLTRMNSLPLSKLRTQKEWNTIQYIAKSNNFRSKIIQRLNQSIQQKMNIHIPQSSEPKRPKKWTAFTYYHPSVRLIINLFKNTDINVAFRKALFLI